MARRRSVCRTERCSPEASPTKTPTEITRQTDPTANVLKIRSRRNQEALATHLADAADGAAVETARDSRFDRVSFDVKVIVLPPRGARQNSPNQWRTKRRRELPPPLGSQRLMQRVLFTLLRAVFFIVSLAVVQFGECKREREVRGAHRFFGIDEEVLFFSGLQRRWQRPVGERRSASGFGERDVDDRASFDRGAFFRSGQRLSIRELCRR